MEEDNGDFLRDTALPLMMLLFVLFCFGYIIYSLIILPIKFAVWTLCGESGRSQSENIFVSNYFSVIAIGVSVLLSIFYGIEIFTDEHGFNIVCHVIMIGFILVPAAFATASTMGQFSSLFDDAQCIVDGEMSDYRVTSMIIFSISWRMIFGLSLLGCLIYYMITGEGF